MKNYNSRLKKMQRYAACAILAAGGAVAPETALGEVYIYTGAAHVQRDLSSQAPAAVKVRAFIDFEQHTLALAYYYSAAGKRIYADGILNDCDLATAPLPHGLTATVLSTGAISLNGADSFSYSLTTYRGANGTVTTRTVPMLAQSNRPRTLSGLSVQTFANAATGGFSDARVALSYQTAASVVANNANQTVQDALKAYTQTLEKQGYMK